MHPVQKHVLHVFYVKMPKPPSLSQLNHDFGGKVHQQNVRERYFRKDDGWGRPRSDRAKASLKRALERRRLLTFSQSDSSKDAKRSVKAGGTAISAYDLALRKELIAARTDIDRILAARERAEKNLVVARIKLQATQRKLGYLGFQNRRWSLHDPAYKTRMENISYWNKKYPNSKWKAKYKGFKI